MLGCGWGARILAELAELAELLSAEAKRASEQERIAAAVDEVIDSHEDILTELAK